MMVIRCRWLLLIVGLSVASPALAFSPAPPRSYKQVAPGGKYVFVMIAPVTVEQDVQNRDEETTGRILEIRRMYTMSGMYRNDGSTEPLWMVGWYAHGVHLAPDGVHLIRHGMEPWLRSGDGTPNLTAEAVSFFANGRLLRTYTVGELVDDPGPLQRSAADYFWQIDEQMNGNFEFTLTAHNGNRLVFDVRTGEITSASWAVSWTQVALWVAFGALAVVVFVAVVAVVWLIRRERSRFRRA